MGTAVLNEVNITSSHLDKYKRLIESTQHWHKFIINNSADIDRNILLDSVLRTVSPNDLIPLHFKKEYLDSHFLAKNCKGAIEELYSKGLVIPDLIYGRQLNVTIILGYKKLSDLDISYHENILKVIHKRYSKVDGTLNLSRFHEDPDLIEYFPLFQSRILEGVLRICKGIYIKSLNLSENRISQLQSLVSIWKNTDIRKLDLSKNMINSVEELQVLRRFKGLEEIILEENPFCARYNGYDYVETVLSVLPNLKKLDFVGVQKDDLLSYKKNYLCCPEGHDFVDQFLDHFFILYDKQRSSLRDMYHMGATLTISCHYNKDRENYATADLECYTCFARNLKTLSDITNSYDNMFVGCDNVMTILYQLPPTNHDPCSFTVDLVSFCYNFAMLTVTGIFQEFGGQILSFNRTFVLVSTDGLHYFIINDKLHVNQATVRQFRDAFDEVSVSNVNAVSEITTMNLEWSKKCLKDCNGDLKEALIAFSELFQKDEIPTQAFERSFFSINPIEFKFKNKEHITPNSSIDIFESEDVTINEITCSKDQKYKNEKSLSKPNKKIQMKIQLGDLRKQNDIFKLARKNLDLKIKQINEAKKAESESENDSKHQRVYPPSLAENCMDLTDEFYPQQFNQKCAYESDKQIANWEEVNNYVGDSKMKISTVMKSRTKNKRNVTRKEFHNPNVIFVDLANNDVVQDIQSTHFKDFNKKFQMGNEKKETEKIKTTVKSTCQVNTALWQNVNIVPPQFKNNPPHCPTNMITNHFYHQSSYINPNLLPQFLNLFPNNKPTKSDTNKMKVTRNKQYVQIQKNIFEIRPKMTVKLLSVLAKRVYRDGQRYLIGKEKRLSVGSIRCKMYPRLSYLAFNAYMNLVYRTQERVSKIININSSDLYMIYRNFIRQPYGSDYNSIRITELNDPFDHFKSEQVRLRPFQNNKTLTQFKGHEQKQFFYVPKNTPIPFQANGIYSLKDTLPGNNMIFSFTTPTPMGNINQPQKRNKFVTKKNKERQRQNSKKRRYLMRQANKLKELINNGVSAQQGPSACSSWNFKGPSKEPNQNIGVSKSKNINKNVSVQYKPPKSAPWNFKGPSKEPNQNLGVSKSKNINKNVSVQYKPAKSVQRNFNGPSKIPNASKNNIKNVLVQYGTPECSSWNFNEPSKTNATGINKPKPAVKNPTAQVTQAPVVQNKKQNHRQRRNREKRRQMRFIKRQKEREMLAQSEH